MMKTENTIFSAHNLSVFLKNKQIFENVCVDIERGDFAVLLGNNGAGKSVLLQTLMGLIPLAKGHIEAKKNLIISYVPQESQFNIHIPLLVKDFLLLKRKYDEVLLKKICQKLNIIALLNSSIREISGGEFQKVLLAHALLKKSDIIILDEPEQNLDLESQIKLYELLETINREEKVAIFMVSHHLHFSLPRATKIFGMYSGKMIAQGNKEKVFATKKFIEYFGSSIDSVFSAYHKVDGHEHF